MWGVDNFQIVRIHFKNPEHENDNKGIMCLSLIKEAVIY